VIPELSIHFVKEFFRFQWLGNRFDLKLLIAYNDTKGLKLLSLKDFWKKDQKAIKWNQLKNQATESMYEFGYMIEDIPPEIANNVEFLVWKIEGASFDVSEIELEEIEVLEPEIEPYNITRFHLPDNLVLSYEDLWLYDFTVSHPNKHETIVEGVKGKTAWNLDPITYSGGVITITDYDTEGGCADHEEIYTQLANASQFAKLGTNQYFSNGLIVIGNGTGSTWFVDSDVQVSFNASAVTANYQKLYEVKDNAYLRFGVLEDASTKSTSHGVSILAQDTRYYTKTVYGNTGSNIYLYSSIFYNEQTIAGYYKGLYGVFKRIWNCMFTHTYIAPINVDADMYNLVFQKGYLGISYPSRGTWNEINLFSQTYAILSYSSYACTVQNVVAKNNTNTFSGTAITTDKYLLNVDADIWTVGWSGVSTAEMYRQYTFDLTFTFDNGSYAEGTNVTISNSYLGTSDSWILTSNGSIPEQTYSYGHYNQTGGNSLYDYNPYNITATLDGYQTYTQLINITEQTTLEIALTEETANGNGSAFNSTYYLLGSISTLPFMLLFAFLIMRRRENDSGL